MKLSPRLSAVIVVVAWLAPASVLDGQTKVGIHGGLAAARFSDLDAIADLSAGVDEGSRTGVRVGVSAAVSVSEGFGIRFEGNYVQAGGRYALADIATNERFDVGIDLDYFRLAAMARAAFPLENHRAAVYLLAGPFVGFRIGCSGALAAEGVSVSVPCDESEIDLPTTDVGVSGGIGIEVGVSSDMGVALEALYDVGLQDLEDGMQNRVFSFVAGLVFSL